MSSLHEVMQQITKCRKAGEVSYSNFYPGESMDTEYQMTAGEKTVVFWRKKEGVFRVYFHTADFYFNVRKYSGSTVTMVADERVTFENKAVWRCY